VAAAAASPLRVLSQPERLAAALPPLRRQLLALLDQPDSATGLARRLDLPRQKVNYHLRELERAGLVELVEERRRRGLVERRVRATARAWLVDPALLATRGIRPEEFQDQFSSAHLVATAASVIGEVATLRQCAEAAGQRLATLTIDTQIAFDSPGAMRAFAQDLQTCLADLTVRYHRPGGRRYRVVAVSHPLPREGT
jgi:DNA-binding transcriptional ArsR family regulator